MEFIIRYQGQDRSEGVFSAFMQHPCPSLSKIVVVYTIQLRISLQVTYWLYQCGINSIRMICHIHTVIYLLVEWICDPDNFYVVFGDIFNRGVLILRFLRMPSYFVTFLWAVHRVLARGLDYSLYVIWNIKYVA